MKKKLICLSLCVLFSFGTLLYLPGCMDITLKPVNEGFTLKTIENDTAYEVIGFELGLTSITIPARIGGIPVKSIGAYAFMSKTLLQRVVIPATVTRIGESAFGGCTQANIIFRKIDNIVYVGKDAFKNTKLEMEYEENPKEPLYIGKCLYRYWGKDRTLIVKSGTRSIASECFYWEASPDQYNKLQSVVLPQSLNIIDDHAFYYCQNLKTIVFPDEMEQLGEGAFYLCENLRSVTLSSGLTALPKDTFFLCLQLKKIIVPASIRQIGPNAFAHCESLSDLILKSDSYIPYRQPFDSSLKKNLTISVPAHLLEAYQTGWEDVADRFVKL